MDYPEDFPKVQKTKTFIRRATNQVLVQRYIDQDENPITNEDWDSCQWTEITKVGDPLDIRRFLQLRPPAKPRT